MAAKKNNTLMYGALAAAGFWLYSKNKETGAAILPADDGAALLPLAPTTGSGGNGGAVPNYITPTPGAVGTPWGPVIPSNFDSLDPVSKCRSLNPTWSETQCSTRLKELLFLHQYIVNSIRNASEFLASGLPQDQNAIRTNIANLQQKKAEREAEYLAFTKEALPAGTIDTPAKVAEYKAFLAGRGYCDPFVGLLCPGYNYGTTPQGQAVTPPPVVTPPTTPVTPPAPVGYTAAQKDVIWRHQYIVDSIANSNAYINSGQAGGSASTIRSQIATLESKRLLRLADWKALGGTGSPPSASSVSLSEYQAFLRANGWCDPYAGIRCPGFNAV